MFIYWEHTLKKMFSMTPAGLDEPEGRFDRPHSKQTASQRLVEENMLPVTNYRSAPEPELMLS